MTTLRGDRVGILGAGAVGTALAVGLADAGYNITAIMSRNAPRAKDLAGRVGGAIHTQQAGLLVDLADTVFLTVPDDVIGVCRGKRAVARRHGGRPLLRRNTRERTGVRRWLWSGDWRIPSPLHVSPELVENNNTRKRDVRHREPGPGSAPSTP